MDSGSVPGAARFLLAIIDSYVNLTACDILAYNIDIRIEIYFFMINRDSGNYLITKLHV